MSVLLATPLLLLLLLLLPGCPAQPPAPLRVGTNPWIGYEPLYLAAGQGFFGSAPIQPIRFASASASIQALGEKKLEAVALTLDEALAVGQFDPDLMIVLVVDFSNGADALLVRPEITKPSEVRERRIGVETGAVGAYMLHRFLDKAQLKESEVSVISLPVDAHGAAYSAGKIDGMITFEPFRTRLLAHGARVIFDSSEIPGEVVDVIVVRASYLQEHPKMVEQLLSGWFKAVNQLNEQPATAAERMRGGLRLSGEEVLKGFAGLRLPQREENRHLLLGSPPPLLATAARVQEVMLAKRLLYKKPDLRMLLDQEKLANLYRNESAR